MPLTNDHKCPECGAELAGGALAGLCPQCLLRRGLGGSGAAGTDSSGDETIASGAANAGPGEGPAPVSAVFQRQKVRYFGDYELLGEVARGGMGVVYRARQVSLNRTVALKMVLAGQLAGEAEARRFRLEAEAAANLDHPSIVPIYEVGEHEGQPYFTMRLIEGGSLAARLGEWKLTAGDRAAKAQTARRQTRLAALLAKVARAVHYAHQRGILHRDLKPGNILLDEQGGPYVTDFGLARKVDGDSSLTISGAIVGTPNYMAPEQAAGKSRELTTAADTYSLGAILYHLLTGRPPFQAESPMETLQRVVSEEPVRPSSIHGQADRDLETICLKCLEKEPGRRYDSAEALAEDLERWLRGEPIQARAVTDFERAIKWARRRPALAALAAVSVAGTAAFIGVLLVNEARLRREKEHASQQERIARRERDAARAATEKAERIVARLELQRAEDMLAADRTPAGLAYLGWVLRQQPASRGTAERLLAVLAGRGFALPVAPPLQHQGRVTVARFSPDGRMILTAGYDREVSLWHGQTGARLAGPARQAERIDCGAFSPDGSRVIVGLRNGQAAILAAGGLQPLAVTGGHQGALWAVGFSPDGRRVFTGSEDGTARMWDAASGAPLTAPLAHGKRVVGGAFSADGAWLLTHAYDQDVRVWDAASGEPRFAPLARFGAQGMAVSPDDQWIATSEADRIIRLWAAATGQPAFEPIRHGSPLTAGMAFSPEGGRLLAVSHDRKARFWEARTGRLLAEFEHTAPLNRGRFSPDGLRAVAAGQDGGVRLLDTGTGRPLCEVIHHADGVTALDFSPDGRFLLTASDAHAAILWGGGDARPVPLEFTAAGQPGTVARLAVSRDGQRLAGTSGSAVPVWDPRTGEPAFPPLKHLAKALLVVFDHDGGRIATAAADKSVRLWDAQTGRLLPGPPPLEHQVNDLAFSRDGRFLSVAGKGRTVSVWDTRTGTMAGPPLEHQSAGVAMTSFSPDGRQLLTASSRVLRVWEVGQGGRLLRWMMHEDVLPYAEWSPDGRRVVSVSRDRTARVWDAETGQPATPPLQHDGFVTFAQFSPDGTRVATASGDGTARIWDAVSGRPLTEPLRHEPPGVELARFSPDGRWLLTRTDGQARVWDAHTGLSITPPLRQGTGRLQAVFSADGRQVFTAGTDGAVRAWPLPQAPLPVPGWLADLAEAVGGLRLTEERAFEAVPTTRLVELRQRLAASPAEDDYGRWGRWFFADPATRPLWPGAAVTVADRLAYRLRQPEAAGLRELLLHSPGNAAAWLKLADLLDAQAGEGNPRAALEAAFYRRHAGHLARLNAAPETKPPAPPARAGPIIPPFSAQGNELQHTNQAGVVSRGWLPQGWQDARLASALGGTYTRLADPPQPGLTAVRVRVERAAQGPAAPLQIRWQSRLQFAGATPHTLRGWMRSPDGTAFDAGVRQWKAPFQFHARQTFNAAAEWAPFALKFQLPADFQPEEDHLPIVLLILRQPGTLDLAGVTLVEE